MTKKTLALAAASALLLAGCSMGQKPAEINAPGAKVRVNNGAVEVQTPQGTVQTDGAGGAEVVAPGGMMETQPAAPSTEVTVPDTTVKTNPGGTTTVTTPDVKVKTDGTGGADVDVDY